MKRGWLYRLRLHRRWIVQAVTLMLVTPLLLGLLPDTGRSAEAMLMRDLAFSVCGPDSREQGPDGQQHPAHADSCLLCSVCAAAGRSLPVADQAFTEPRHSPAPAVHALSSRLRPPQALLLFGSPPRGPPPTHLV